MERSEISNEAEWSDERRGHCCISRIEIMPYAAFLLPSNFCVSKIGLTAIRKPHLECRTGIVTSDERYLEMPVIN